MKLVDWGWTAWDMHQSLKVINDPNASEARKNEAAANIAMAITMEAVEPDDLLPFALPLDDLARKGVIKVGKEAGEEVAEEAAERAAKGVKPFQVGKYDDLKKIELPNDGLEIHHAPQKVPAAQAIPGYNAKMGPSIALPESMHHRIPARTGVYAGKARDLFAQDLWNLRQAGVPRDSIQELLSLTKEMYPGALAK